MSKEPSIEEAIERAKRTQEDRINAIRGVGEARQNLADVREVTCRFSPRLSDVHGCDLHVLPPGRGSFLAQSGTKFAVRVHGVCRRFPLVPSLRVLLDHDTA